MHSPSFQVGSSLNNRSIIKKDTAGNITCLINDLKGSSVMNNLRKSNNTAAPASAIGAKRSKVLALRRSNSEKSILKQSCPSPAPPPSSSRVPPVILDEEEELKAAPWYQPGLSRCARHR